MSETVFLIAVTVLAACNLAARVGMEKQGLDPKTGPSHIGS